MFKMIPPAVALAAILLASPGAFAEEAGDGKALSLENVTYSCYALGGDVKTLKDPVEAVYVTKGDAVYALFWLKQMIVEGKREQKYFEVKDHLCVTVFRGFFPGLSKVLIKKVSLKGNELDVHAEYSDNPEYSVPTQPAAIIPIGQLPPGQYTVNLFVGNELRKTNGFKVKGR
ncbi:MAG: hypothetical protein PHH20_04715 [Candidatus Omnitrophica bacterium]|nr:hypothetical protein [Candidatus Omnitrophota bacterium]